MTQVNELLQFDQNFDFKKMIEKISYERCVYESVDVRSLYKVISRKLNFFLPNCGNWLSFSKLLLENNLGLLIWYGHPDLK